MALRIDPELIKTLAALLDELNLTEIEYAKGDERVHVARAATGAVVVAPGQPTAQGPRPAPSTVDHPGVVKSPMVGTVYLSPEPGTPAFIKAGDTVTEGQTLLLIEAMKTYNPVRAPRAGKVTRILVSDGTPVEFGEALLIIE
jgi:acetyl-CoA carboxylase biotin carboxyl carrier protein